MSRLSKGVLVVVLLLALIMGASLSWGDTSPGPKAYGMTYGEWGAAWWQWVNISPFSKHPLLDTSGKWASFNQMESAFVFLLGGTWTGAPVVRTVTVPAGKAFFFPLFNWVLFYPEDVPADYRSSEQVAEAWIRQTLNDTFDSVNTAELECRVDGVKVENPTFRGQSPAFSMYLPPDSYEVIKDHSLTTGLPYQAGMHYPAVADGYWMMLEPLPAGLHTVQILAGPPEARWQDVTYNLTVVP